MFKDYPLAPEKNDIQKEWLSNYCLEIANKHNTTTATVKKLMPNLMNRNNCDSLQKLATMPTARNEIKENIQNTKI